MPAPPSPPPRYTDAPLPPYRYRPGRGDPHPLRDPRGYAYGAPEGDEALSECDWATSRTYLYAIDLFNHGYYWACHEALEGLWRGSGRDSEVGVRLQGLIQVAAALLKYGLGQVDAARRLAARGTARLRAGPPVRLGVDGPDLARRVEARLAGVQAYAPIIRLDGLAPADGRA